LILEARQIYDDTLKLSPKFAQALNHLGYCLSYLGEHQAAIEILKKYKSLDETYNAYDSLGDGYYYAGDYERAELYKQAALQKNPSIDWIYRSLSDIYLTTGRIKNALAMNDLFKQAAKNDPRRLAEAALQRAQIYLLTNKRSEAKVQIEEARSLYGKQEIFSFIDEMPYLSGRWFIEGGQTSMARIELNWLETIVKKHSIGKDKYFTFYKHYLHLKALCEYNEGKTAEARETMSQLCNLGPALSYWITFYHRSFYLTEAARIEYEMKNYDVAIELLTEALRFIPNYPYALFYQAKVYVAKKDYRNAKVSAKAYIEICKNADTDYQPLIEMKNLLK
jgi:tetratricopeptide (TPR) repeat protein